MIWFLEDFESFLIGSLSMMTITVSNIRWVQKGLPIFIYVTKVAIYIYMWTYLKDLKKTLSSRNKAMTLNEKHVSICKSKHTLQV